MTKYEAEVLAEHIKTTYPTLELWGINYIGEQWGTETYEVVVKIPDRRFNAWTHISDPMEPEEFDKRYPGLADILKQQAGEI